MTSDRWRSSGEPHELGPNLGRLLGGQEGIGRDHPHLERGCAARDRLADLAEPDDPQRLATQLATGVAAALPLPGTDRCVRLRNPAQHREHERHRVLGGGDRVAGRGVDDHHARPRRRLDVDAVDPDRGHAHDREARRRGGEQLRIDPRLRPDDERVPAAALAEQGEQLRAGQAEAHRRLVRGGEGIDAGLGDRLGDEDASHIASLAGHTLRVSGAQRGPIEVVVEIPSGSRNKYEYDHVRHRFVLDRILVLERPLPVRLRLHRGQPGR